MGSTDVWADKLSPPDKAVPADLNMRVEEKQAWPSLRVRSAFQSSPRPCSAKAGLENRRKYHDDNRREKTNSQAVTRITLTACLNLMIAGHCELAKN